MNENGVQSVVITQSNYIPWKGYFDQIASADCFVFYDCAQYTRRDWRNRNRIKTSQGLKWLTIPVNTKGSFNSPISEIQVANFEWAEQHWETLRHAYSKAECFLEVEPFIRGLYESVIELPRLTDINKTFILAISKFLGLSPTFKDSTEFQLKFGKTERLLGICRDLGARTYVSGPAAQDYLNETSFQDEGIAVSWFQYDGYPEYPQLYGDFIHGVSVLDLLFAVGARAGEYIRKTR